MTVAVRAADTGFVTAEKTVKTIGTNLRRFVVSGVAD